MIESFALPYGDVLTLAILLKKLPIQIVVPGEAKAIYCQPFNVQGADGSK